MRLFQQRRSSGITLVEIMVTSVLIGVVGLIVFSLLNSGTILSAKNIAVNTAHQQARTAMLQMVQDIHGAVSLPQLVDAYGSPTPVPSPGTSPPAAGIAFQSWSMGPFQVSADANKGQKVIQLLTSGGKSPVTPVTGAQPQRLILPLFEIEDDIMSVSAVAGTNKVNITLANNLPVDVKNTTSSSFHVNAYITDRCAYMVQNKALEWRGPTARVRFAVMGNGITNDTPFSIPITQNGTGGAYDYKFIAAIDLSTEDSKYSARKFKAANILLNGKVPLRARLTKFQ